MKKFISSTLLVLTILSCKENSKDEAPPAIDVTGYLKGQLKLLDTVPYAILKITEKVDGKTDSVYLKKNELAEILAPFITDEINQDHLSKNYFEKSFADASTKTVNITYDAENKDASIHQVVIYVNPESGGIRQVYITGFFENKGSILKKQLLWLHDKGFQIISTSEGNADQTVYQIEKILWQ